MKFEQLPKTNRNGRELSVENGIVRSVSISNADNGCLTAWVHIEFYCGGCGFGGFMLGLDDGGNLAESKPSYAAEFLVRCMNTIGCSEWESLKGKPLRCLHEGLGGSIVAIGHFMEDKWFCPRVEFEMK